VTGSWWYAYSCAPNGLHYGEEVLADVRCGRHEREPVVKCPLCGQHMHFRARWEADSSGFGSRGDSDLPTNLARAAAALERERCARVCEGIAEVRARGDSGRDDVALACASACRAEGRPT
jgi:ssDNA-binding Zn-finger/Zn-ribbon topoisomerase 1